MTTKTKKLSTGETVITSLLTGVSAVLFGAFWLMLWYGAAAVDNGWHTISYGTAVFLVLAFGGLSSGALSGLRTKTDA